MCWLKEDRYDMGCVDLIFMEMFPLLPTDRENSKKIFKEFRKFLDILEAKGFFDKHKVTSDIENVVECPECKVLHNKSMKDNNLCMICYNGAEEEEDFPRCEKCNSTEIRIFPSGMDFGSGSITYDKYQCYKCGKSGKMVKK